MRPLQRIALFFFERTRLTAILALAVVVFGALCYTTLLKREGFPTINVPFAIGQGAYLVNDPAEVDKSAAAPVSKFLADQPEIKQVQTTSLGNFYTVFAQYKEGTNPQSVTKNLQDQILDKRLAPEQSKFSFEAARFGFTERGDDAVVSYFSVKNANTPEAELIAGAQKAAEFIASQKGLIKSASIISPVESAKNPLTGESQQIQSRFERFGERQDGKTEFYTSIPIGVSIVKGGDVIDFGDQLEEAVAAYNETKSSDGSMTRVSASFAPSIRQQIGELQKTLFEGFIAVLIIGSIVIAVRASFITVLSMLTVILATLGVLKLVGYSLNTITLFSLILGLSLIVDDTIIMVEAMDAQRKRKTNANNIVSTAVGKVGGAMIAATLTAVLSFTPLLFVGGILGEFIRAIPTTIISALLISLGVALIFIPYYARFLMLGRKHLGKNAEHEVAEDFERAVARGLSAPMLWAQHSRKRLVAVCLAALSISLIFIGASGYLFGKVKFNIFPAAKDSNQIQLTLAFAPSTTIKTAEQATDKVLEKVKTTLGENFAYTANYGQANAQQATFTIELIDYNKRKPTATQLIENLKNETKNTPNTKVTVSALGAGGPAGALSIQVAADKNRAAAQKLADTIARFIRSKDIKKLDGTKVGIESVEVGSADVYTRTDNKLFIGVTPTFTDTDTSAVFVLVQNAVEKEFTPERVASYGLEKDAVSFNTGQEQENTDSFKTLAMAFPAVLLMIFIVLAIQFRSLLQPLLIFMAIPFSLFGITLGLWLTDNPFSFFAMLGFFALIGLSIKNTILLTDYANQARRAGMNPVDAAHEALAERFRPLIATSLTAIVSIIPLALTSPFWQGLAVVLMFGLLSSTFLVVTVYPYYYLMGEFARGATRRQFRRLIRKK